MLSDKVIGRLSLYRRIVKELAVEGIRTIFSHDLARIAGVTAAQVRRDVMRIGYSGSPARGYDIEGLVARIDVVLDPTKPVGVGLVGLGNLGRAILGYFATRNTKLRIVAAFDNDPNKIGHRLQGCLCHSIGDVERVVGECDIRLAIITVPGSEAQDVADALGRAGVRGLVNYAPIRLRVPHGIYVENVDMAMALERVAYFACEGLDERNA
ncbi:MAG TPA: redox-sensing transcriptional repressor Rex [Candidatus Hydrogenedentes bacterium]|nr:redox-sensing transcriptional repressor Rex [Candidatus Hydrogenedentota bacterium]HPG68603.1 redox-sensing transcriptional repressor Rex [Candidatus Hydrogenedentota bacterium]